MPLSFPTSGRYGYFIINGIEIPIYTWNLSSSMMRTHYATAAGAHDLSLIQLYPVRKQGPLTDTIELTGPHYNTTYPYMQVDPWVCEIGWYDWANNLRHFIKMDAKIFKYERVLNYSSGANPSFTWSASLYDVSKDTSILSSPYYRLIESRPIGTYPPNDFRCPEQLCMQPIYSRLMTSPEGDPDSWTRVKYVTRATLTEESETTFYATSDSLPRNQMTNGVFNRTLSMNVQGDFDLWYQRLMTKYIHEIPEEFRFPYGPGTMEYFNIQNAVIEEMSDLRVNVQTAEILSANVRLTSTADF